jgi:thioredoxin-related protein
MKRIIFVIAFLLLTGITFSQERPQPYNEKQDVRADLNKAIAQAKKENKHVLIQLGGNWCSWCLRFHKLVQGDPRIDSIMKKEYVYLLMNVPRSKEERDQELFRKYDYPNRFGFPVFVILDKDGKRLNTQDSEALEYPDPTKPGYDTTRVVRFLNMWTVKALDPASYKK